MADFEKKQVVIGLTAEESEEIRRLTGDQLTSLRIDTVDGQADNATSEQDLWSVRP